MPDQPSALRCVQAALMCALGVWLAGSSEAADSVSTQNFAQVERGRYLTVAADCAACHSNPGSNAPFSGGRRIETPFGVLAASNITPDRSTGIGAWSAEEFDRALRAGVMPDGRHLYPAMPFQYFTRMSRDDVLAIRAYLNTLAPVRNEVHSNQLPFPFNIRALMQLWDALFFEPGELKNDPDKSEAWNRGAYLVEGPGHCAACHSPKNFFGADKSGQRLRGYGLQGWFAPNITNDDAQGLGHWSAADIVAYLKKGHNRLAGASGPMAEEIANSSSRMKDSDLEAIAAYLKEQPGQSTTGRSLPAEDRFMQAGAAIYADRCAACHKADGTGVPFLIPDLAHSSAVASVSPQTVLRVVLRGASTVSTAEEPTGPGMPMFAWQLNDPEVAAVTTYIRNSWGHAAPAVTASEAGKARKSLAKRRE